MPDLDPIRQKYILDTSGVVAGSQTGYQPTAQDEPLNRELYGSFRLAIRRAGAAAFAVLLGSIFKAIQGFIKFQKEMAEVETLINANTAAIGHLSAEVRRLARVTPLALSDLTKGLYQTISAAVPAEEAMKFLGVAARAAVAGVTEVSIAVDGMTSVMNAFGLEAKDATDIADTFFVAIRDGKTTFPELAKSIGTVAPAAADVGLSFQDLAAGMAAMTLQGISTDKAAVAFRGIFTSLNKPSQDAIDLAKELGIECNALSIKEKGQLGFLRDLKLKTDAYAGAITTLVGNSRAANGMNALLNSGLDDLARIQGDTTRRTGEAEEAYRKLNITGDTTWKTFKNRIGDVFQQLGEKTFPLVESGIRAITKALNDARDPSERIADVFASLGIEIEGMSDEFDRLLIAQNNAKFAGKVFDIGVGVKTEHLKGQQTNPLTGETVTVDWGIYHTNVINKQLKEDFWKGFTDEEKLNKVKEFVKQGVDALVALRDEEARAKRELPKGDDLLRVLADRAEMLQKQIIDLHTYGKALEDNIGARKRLAESGAAAGGKGGIELPKILLRTKDPALKGAADAADKLNEKLQIVMATNEKLKTKLQELFALRGQRKDVGKDERTIETELSALLDEEATLTERLNIMNQNRASFSAEQFEQAKKELAAKKEEIAKWEDELRVIYAINEAGDEQIKNLEEAIQKLRLTREEIEAMPEGPLKGLALSLLGNKRFHRVS